VAAATRIKANTTLAKRSIFDELRSVSAPPASRRRPWSSASASPTMPLPLVRRQRPLAGRFRHARPPLQRQYNRFALRTACLFRLNVPKSEIIRAERRSRVQRLRRP
jgi:hypothetical protein